MLSSFGVADHGSAGVGLSHPHRPTPATTANTPATLCQSQLRWAGGGAAMIGAGAGATGCATSSRAAFKSRADCQRFSGSFSRQRFNTRSSAAGAMSMMDGASRRMRRGALFPRSSPDAFRRASRSPLAPIKMDRRRRVAAGSRRSARRRTRSSRERESIGCPIVSTSTGAGIGDHRRGSR